jgi:hypothetical protein
MLATAIRCVLLKAAEQSILVTARNTQAQLALLFDLGSAGSSFYTSAGEIVLKSQPPICKR